MKQNGIRVFFISLLLGMGLSNTSLFAEKPDSNYEAEEAVYFLTGDFVNEWGFTHFNPADEKWKKENLSLPPVLTKEEIEILLEIEKQGHGIPCPQRRKEDMLCIDYAPFHGNIYVFYGFLSRLYETKIIIVYANEKDNTIFAMTNISGSPYEFSCGFSLPEEYQKKWFRLISSLKNRFEEYQKKEQNIVNKKNNREEAVQ